MANQIIGYQIENKDGSHEIPECFFSFEVFTKIEDCENWIKNSEQPNKWIITPIKQGDIEEPTLI